MIDTLELNIMGFVFWFAAIFLAATGRVSWWIVLLFFLYVFEVKVTWKRRKW